MSAELDFSKTYGFARGFSFRKEAFGGIICHFEGHRPDPRLYFVNSPFLVGLLDLLGEAPLETLIGEAALQFGLTAAEVGQVRQFFSTLASRGAFVPQ